MRSPLTPELKVAGSNPAGHTSSPIKTYGDLISPFREISSVGHTEKRTDHMGRTPMSKRAGRFPKLIHHKASNQGVVRLDCKDVYCGPFGTPECQARYLRALADWSERGHLAATPEN